MKIFIWILTFLVVLILGVVYVKISTPNTFTIKETEEKLIEIKKPEIKTPIIYNFPARVMYMKVDFRNFKNIILYRVILKVKDRFELFNLKAMLNNNDLVYSMIEEKKGIKVYILFKSLTEAESILNLFKEYNFNVEIQKIKKRI